MTKEELQEALKQSMLARSELKTSVLRMLLSAINYSEIQKGGAGYSATEEDVMSAVQSEAKKRRDSIEQYQNANRHELADKETQELKILEKYLPEQMGKEEISGLVDEAIKQTNASNIQDMGKVMGALMVKVKGKADGGLVSEIVKEKLTS